MPTNECIPWFHPGESLTVHATPAAIRGKRFVTFTGSQGSGPLLSTTNEGGNIIAQEAGAGLKAQGVAKYDAAIGFKTGVWRAGVVPMTSGAAVAAGAGVQSDAQGRAITLAAGIRLGTAVTAAAGADVDFYVALEGLE